MSIFLCLEKKKKRTPLNRTCQNQRIGNIQHTDYCSNQRQNFFYRLRLLIVAKQQTP